MARRRKEIVLPEEDKLISEEKLQEVIAETLENDAEMYNLSDYRLITDHYMQVQKLRVALENRIRAIQQGKDTSPRIPSWMVRSLERLQREEQELTLTMKFVAGMSDVYKYFLKHVKGLGPVLAVKLIGLIDDIGRFATVAKLWRYAGLAVINGKAEKPVKGEKRHYNLRLKTLMYVIGSQFLKAAGRTEQPYARIYYDARAYYKANRPDWTKLHIHYASMRKMEKLFLAHLWHVWRSLEGLPLRRPYAEARLGHTVIDPWQFNGIEKPDWVKEVYIDEPVQEIA